MARSRFSIGRRSGALEDRDLSMRSTRRRLALGREAVSAIRTTSGGRGSLVSSVSGNAPRQGFAAVSYISPIRPDIDSLLQRRRKIPLLRRDLSPKPQEGSRRWRARRALTRLAGAEWASERGGVRRSSVLRIRRCRNNDVGRAPIRPQLQHKRHVLGSLQDDCGSLDVLV